VQVQIFQYATGEEWLKDQTSRRGRRERLGSTHSDVVVSGKASYGEQIYYKEEKQQKTFCNTNGLISGLSMAGWYQSCQRLVAPAVALWVSRGTCADT
jgi:hypothetical protein